MSAVNGRDGTGRLGGARPAGEARGCTRGVAIRGVAWRGAGGCAQRSAKGQNKRQITKLATRRHCLVHWSAAELGWPRLEAEGWGLRWRGGGGLHLQEPLGEVAPSQLPGQSVVRSASERDDGFSQALTMMISYVQKWAVKCEKGISPIGASLHLTCS